MNVYYDFDSGTETNSIFLKLKNISYGIFSFIVVYSTDFFTNLIIFYFNKVSSISP
jgi:hypothetical protein